MKRSSIVIFSLVATVSLLFGGCGSVGDFFKTDETRFFSPNKMVWAPDNMSVSPILPSVGLGDQYEELVPNADFPREGDWSFTPTDYIIGPTDVVDVAVMDLFQQGLETPIRRQVSNSGYITLPLLSRRVKAEGLTSDGLTDAVKAAYQQAQVLQDPIVSVTVAAQRQNTYSVLGSVARSGTYQLPRRDTRLLEALATAGGLTQVNVRYLYVIRPKSAHREGGAESEDVGLPELPALPDIPDQGDAPTDPNAAATGDTTPPKSGETNVDDPIREFENLLEGGGGQTGEQAPGDDKTDGIPLFSEQSGSGAGPVLAQADSDASPRTKWVYSGGRWIQTTVDAPQVTEPSGAGAAPVVPHGKPPVEPQVTSPREEKGRRTIQPQQPVGEGDDPYGWKQVERLDMARVIAINVDQLYSGDPRMNIVIRDNDIIRIPTLEVGEFYIGGEVLRPGVYSLTGRRVTVKQAVTAAGDIGQLGWPSNSILIRRIGENEEQVMALDIESIFRGDEPDVFLRPDDQILVGSDIRAPFWAVIRNAFRLTYGFGFIWDRNFADPFNGDGVDSERFKRF